jgi:methyltransferase (TIGR00027 family)
MKNGLRDITRTALWTAAARMRESRRPDRLFDDPLAEILAGADGAALLQHFHTAHAAKEGNPFLSIRTRWFDDFLYEAVTPGSQVVDLGAGLDTRAFRLGWPANTTLFEIDQAALLSYKEAKLAPHGARRRCEHRAVAGDFAGDWTSPLRDAGFDPGRPTVWFAEGLLFYLPERLARRLLRQTAALSAPGSRIAIDLIGTGIFRMAYMRQFLRRLEQAGSPWRFGTDEPRRFIETCGWNACEVTEPGRRGASYGRWPERATAAGFPSLPRSYLVTAALPEAPPFR